MLEKIMGIVCSLSFLASCVNTQKAVYFNNQGDTTLSSGITIPENTIAPNDLLSITVTSLNPTASIVFNAPNLMYSDNASGATNAAPVQASGYLVDAAGNIQFPVLGTIRAGGITIGELKRQIVQNILDKKLLLDPVVTIRHLNFRVTVLGEVARPSVINVPSEKITLLEALGLAGDITVYGKREKILLIREQGGQKVLKRLNLNSSEIFDSPYYYLRSNDIVYIEPNKAKVAGASRSYQLLPIVLSGLSFIAIIADRLTR